MSITGAQQAGRVDAGERIAVVAGRHGDPFAVLGRHGRRICTFQPGARAVEVLNADGRLAGTLDCTDEAGFFEGPIDGLAAHEAYRFRLRFDHAVIEIEDPYRFGTILGDTDVHLLAEGRHLRLYEKLGAHPLVMEGVSGVAFAVWAPNAVRASVVGSFNHWDGRRHPMRKRVECGVFELFVPGVGKGELYKFELIAADGTRLALKADPLAMRAQHPPESASVVEGLVTRNWRDRDWLDARAARQARTAPIAIYEVHLGSWARVHEDGHRYLSYLELRERLIPYVLDMGFTHIELMPVSEYPFDGSWGYQPTGLFAPTIRHGTALEFAEFVEACHLAGLGLIIDWVPGHFPSDAHGLARFDGTALYEHADPRQGVHRDWNTLIYNYGRNEVRNFLVANGLYWLDRFHVDGLRVDAVASMLYLDYSREEGQWIPNEEGGRENLDAIAFLRMLNVEAYGAFPDIATIAEESTAFPAVSQPTNHGGLGFGYKWNMGWMNDTLRYMAREPVHRKHHQDDLTFGLLYAFSENFVLPLSHDEVVHGKGSLLDRMPGDDWQKFANLRAYFGFMWAHPGKKLLFMGGEFAQRSEWNHDVSLDWHLLANPMHKGVQTLVRDLNRLYGAEPALHRLDCDSAGFEWIDASDTESSVLSFLRKDGEGRCALIVCNFTPVPRDGYRIGVDGPGAWAERINTDATIYGGSGIGNGGRVEADETPWHGRPASMLLTLPPLATLILTPDR